MIQEIKKNFPVQNRTNNEVDAKRLFDTLEERISVNLEAIKAELESIKTFYPSLWRLNEIYTVFFLMGLLGGEHYAAKEREIRYRIKRDFITELEKVAAKMGIYESEQFKKDVFAYYERVDALTDFSLEIAAIFKE